MLLLTFVLFVVSGAELILNDVIPPYKRHQPHLVPIINQLEMASFMNNGKGKVVELAAKAGQPTLYPTDFGADPFGKADSSTAFQAAIKELFLRGSGHRLADGIMDLGGATLDLGGGDYLISNPIIIPVNYGNFRIQTGTLRASANFPKDRYLIEIGSTSCSNGQGSCNENVGLSDLMLDSQLIAAGGLLITATMGANVGPQMFFLGFTKAGISVQGGHETMIHETWLGQYLYSDPRNGNPTATAIEILGNDHYITNTIVFSSRIGVLVTGAANLLTGVHTWNMASSKGGIGIYVNAPGYTQNRLIACYLDFNSVIAVAPEHLTIEQSFFLCGGNIVLVATANHRNIMGLNIIGNQWDQCKNESIVLDQTQATFTDIYDTNINNNLMYPSSLSIRSTQATAQLNLTQATQWSFDFSNRLLFGDIKSVTYSLEVEGTAFARHVSRPPKGRTVLVETDVPVSGTVTVVVDQSKPSQPCGKTC